MRFSICYWFRKIGLQNDHWTKQILTLWYVIYGRWLPCLSSYPFMHDYAFMDYFKGQRQSIHTTELKLGLWDESLSNHTTVSKSPKSPRQGNRLWHAAVTRMGNHKRYKRYNAFPLFFIWATKYIALINLSCPLGAIYMWSNLIFQPNVVACSWHPSAIMIMSSVLGIFVI